MSIEQKTFEPITPELSEVTEDTKKQLAGLISENTDIISYDEWRLVKAFKELGERETQEINHRIFDDFTSNEQVASSWIFRWYSNLEQIV